MDLIITILPVVTKDLPISPRFTPYDFLSRCKFRTLTTRQPMVGWSVKSCILRFSPVQSMTSCDVVPLGGRGGKQCVCFQGDWITPGLLIILSRATEQSSLGNCLENRQKTYFLWSRVNPAATTRALKTDRKRMYFMV